MDRRNFYRGSALIGVAILSGAMGVALMTQKPTETPVWDGRWEPIPLVAAGKAPEYAGEGGQWPRSIGVDSTGKRVILGIDVGGMYRSEDSGASWQPSNGGYDSRGVVAVSFDPRNSNRVIAIGGNSSPFAQNGIWQSLNGGKTWVNRLPVYMGGLNEWREQIVWDTTSYDAATKVTKRALWSRIKNDSSGWGTPEEHPALYRTEDGGATWAEVPNSAPYAGGIVRAVGQTVYSAQPDGLFRSKNFGTTWTRLRTGSFTGVDAQGTSLWATTAQEIFKSTDGGDSFTTLPGPSQSGHILKNIKVSPADPLRMVLWRDQDPNYWDWRRFYSSDGGQTWNQSTLDTAKAFLPVNSRQGIFCWHPTNKNVVWSMVGDILIKSTDGGKTFRWSNRGYNGVFVGGLWAFSVRTPSTVFVGSQDYNGAVTIDSGRTWKYTNVSGNGWGGFTYGGYALDPNVLWVANADSWGGKRILRVSRDGGISWTDTGIELSGLQSSYGDPRNAKVGFAFNHRTTDAGLIWSKMTGCSGVMTHTPDGTLYGADDRNVVRSTDSGATWSVVATAEGDVQDVAVDPKRNRVYAVFNERAAVFSGGAWEYLPIPTNQVGWHSVRSVCVDPARPHLVYVGSAANLFISSVPVLASSDAGRTWTNLTLNRAPKGEERDGGKEAMCVRVHPRTGDLWVTTNCFGIWKYVRLPR